MSPAEALDAVRASLGPPRKRRLSSANRVRIPPWLNGKNPMIAIKRKQDLLLREGEVVWAALVQANNLIFQPGAPIVPGALLYSTDPASFDRPHSIAEAARGLFAQKGGRASNPWLQPLIDAISDEHKMLMKEPLPPEGADGLACFYTSAFLDPRHLPNGVLDVSIMPILRHDKTDACLVVPHWHWPASMLAFAR